MSADKQREGFQRTRKALEQLFGPLSDRETRCAVMAYNDAGIHAARSSCAATVDRIVEVVQNTMFAYAGGLKYDRDLQDQIIRLTGFVEQAIREQSAVPESGRTESGWTPIQQINAAGPETVGGSIAKPSGPEDFAISPAAPSTPQPGAPTPRTEREALLLAAISTAAGQNTRESAKQRIGRDNPYWTPAYEDVCAAVDREMALREQLEAARSASAERDPWKEAVIEALVCNHIYRKEHDDDPRKALNELLAWEQAVALDPKVSSAAEALVEQGRRSALSSSTAPLATSDPEGHRQAIADAEHDRLVAEAAQSARADVDGEAIWVRFIDHLNAVEPIVFKKSDGQVPHANLHGSIEHYKRIFLESQSNSPRSDK